MKKTGWPPGMLQDDDRKLSRWFASRPGARYQVRKNIMEKQPEALRLADALEEKEYPPRRAAAAELRRLHNVNVQLLEALENLERTAGQPATRDEPVRVKARAAIAAAKENT